MIQGMVLAVAATIGMGDDPKPEAAPAPPAAVSFMKDVAPLLVKNCIACHNARKSESKYNMVNFAALAKGGQQGEDITLEPGKPAELVFDFFPIAYRFAAGHRIRVALTTSIGEAYQQPPSTGGALPTATLLRGGEHASVIELPLQPAP